MRSLGILLALSVVILVAAACAGQGAAAPKPTAAPPSTVTASPTPVNNSTPGAIEGTVTGLDGQPVVGMRMGIVSGTAPYPEIGPSTDEKGYYRLSGLTPGTYEVAVHDDQGGRVGLKSVVVNSGETATLDFSVSVGAATETQALLPPLPVIRLRYSGRLHDGVEGSRCWPYKRAADGSVVGLCADTGPSPDFGAPIPVDVGDSITVEIEADTPPQDLTATFYEIDSATQPLSTELALGLEVPLPVDMPAGTYNVRIVGNWADGDVAHHFRIEVGFGSP